MADKSMRIDVEQPAKANLPKKTAPEGCGGVLDFKKRAFTSCAWAQYGDGP